MIRRYGRKMQDACGHLMVRIDPHTPAGSLVHAASTRFAVTFIISRFAGEASASPESR